MTEKELKKLSRTDLLELLLAQTRETERLQKELDSARQMLSDRNLRIQKAGDLAHAVLEINEVAKAAQNAAQQYLDNIAAMEQQTRLHCQKLLEEARAEVEHIRKTGEVYPHGETEENDLLAEIYQILDQ